MIFCTLSNVHFCSFQVLLHSLLSTSSLLQTEVTTVICGQKELKKLADVSGQLDTVKRVICIDNEIPSSAIIAAGSNWVLKTFSEVETLGRGNPVDPDLPVAADTAVIMYTSGSTGLPKVNCDTLNLLLQIGDIVLFFSWLENYV